MDFEDPLADILSDGSNDSFFDEPKPTAKRGSITKTPEKKSISDLFGLNEDKREEQQKSAGGSADDWLGLTITKSPKKTIQQPLIKTAKKISFEDDDDILNTLGLEKKSEPKPVEKTTEVFAPTKLEPAKKSALLESILGTSKKPEEKLPDLKFTTKPESKPTPEPVKAAATPKSDQSYGFQSLDAPREGRRRPASGIKDPLGLFSTDTTSIQSEKKPEPNRSIQASPVRKRDSNTTPDWLGQTGDGDKSNTRTEVLFAAKGDLKTKSAPNLTNLPDWLTNEPIKSHKSDTGINNIEQQQPLERAQETPQQIVNDDQRESATFQSILTQQKLATSHMEYQNTSIALQQQESQILMTLQLKKYEENLMDMQRKQQDLLVKQEQQFNSLLERQFAKQQILENNMRLQQERINNHIQMLLTQPPVTAIPTSQVEEITKTEELKKLNSEETVKLYENLIESLKQRHHEELFLVEESYKKQLSTMEQSSEAVENRLKEELDNMKKSYTDKYETLRKEQDLEGDKFNQRMSDLTERHKSEIRSLRDNHDRIVEEVKYECNTVIENIKQFKQTETNIFENAINYNEKLDNNMQMLGMNGKILFDLKEKVEKDYGVLTMAREENLKAKEEEIKLMRIALDKAREAAETERSQLMGLIRSLELKLVEQTQNVKEERWAMEQAASTLVSRTSALEREAEYNRKSIEYEREQLKTLKETLLREQERIILQLTEEKLTLAGERSKLETTFKLNQSYDSQRAKAEIEAAVKIANEATAMTDREREQLQRQQLDVENVKRILIDRERKLEQKEIELNKLTQSANRKANEGERALNEAKSLESNYNERLRSIQNQLVHLTNREKRLAEEKIALSKERLAFNNFNRQRKKCSLCAIDDVPKSLDEDVVQFEHVEQDSINISHVINSELTNLRKELQQTRRKFKDTMSE